MQTGMNNRDSAPRRSPQLAQFLRQAETPEVLPWSRAVNIIAAAPPARVSFFSLAFGAQPMRLATGLAALLILGTGALAVIPAQAGHVGTIISTQLPSAWHAGSSEMLEFQHQAQDKFGALALPDSHLYLLNTTQENGRPELAVVMQNVEATQAQAFYAALAQQYPALDAEGFEPQVQDVEGDSPGSLLSAVLAGVVQPARLSGLSDSEAQLHVLKALDGMGLTPTEVHTSRQPDGTLIIDISAQMQIQVKGHTQEDLAGRGLSRETLGTQGFEELLKAAQ